MNFSEFEDRRRFQQAWEAVRIARAVEYSLFTFGTSDLPYFLVCDARPPQQTVTITRGDVRITRPLIITPDNVHPEFRNFFENDDEGLLAEFFIQRTAAFSNLQFENQHGPARIVTDSVDEAVAKLNRQLDQDEEDRVAILCAPASLAGFAAFRYAAERMMRSVPDNIQELRERGLLP
ncbi:MAG: hypothetical protein HY290_08635 [Planctomycetia bacterium]|nr:hypothetical protein [Planctomycetia bacterium]